MYCTNCVVGSCPLGRSIFTIHVSFFHMFPTLLFTTKPDTGYYYNVMVLPWYYLHCDNTIQDLIALSKKTNHYLVLELPHDFKPSEVKRTYRRISRTYGENIYDNYYFKYLCRSALGILTGIIMCNTSMTRIGTNRYVPPVYLPPVYANPLSETLSRKPIYTLQVPP